MKGSRLYKVLSVALSFMLVFSLFPTQALAAVGEEGGEELTVVSPTYYDVTFQDYDGTFITTVSVEQGQAATAPAHPTRDGYVADGWDVDFSNVTSNLTVTAVYQPVKLHIYIYIGNGTSNLLQHYVMSPLTNAQITAYSGLTNKALVNRLQTDTGFALAGKSSFISNSDMTGNGTVQLESTSDPTVYNVYIHLKDNLDVDYTVRYVDDAGNQLHDPYEGSGHIGATITKSAISISGYTLVSESPKSITLNFGSNVITFVYTRTYTITYNLNGGTNNPANPSTYTKLTPTFTLQNPTKLGYTFTGWSPTDTTIELGSTGNLTFTASWTLTNYNIIYVLNGGVNNSSNPATYTYNSATITLLNPTRAGYNFLNWSPSNKILNHSTGDKTFTASWSAALSYNITYDLNGGVNDGSNPTTYTVESGDITLAAATRAGYNFLGWDPTGFIASGSTGDKHFDATWSSAVEYNISYNLNGGVNDPSNPDKYTIESADITLASPTRDGYLFTGWSPTGFIGHGSTGDRSFTATWSAPIVYNITYELNGGVNDGTNPTTYTVESADITLAAPTKDGYNFLGWDPTGFIGTGSTGDKHFEAMWSEAIEYAITYNLNGGVNDSSNPDKYTVESADITLANPTKAGYNFLGWDPTGFIANGSTGDKSFTAQWSAAIVYNISYDLAGGVNNGSNPSTYTVESATINLAAPTRTGYNFTGWTPGSSIPNGSTGDKSFVATWSSPIDYSITYVLGGGTNDPANPATYNVASPTITLGAPTRLGYNFLGWNPTGVIAAGSTGNKTFTARWSAAIRYNITYTMNGGINNLLNPSGYTVNSGTITLRDPVRLGYDFAGWTPTNSIPTGSTGDKAFTANWTAKVYEIHYYMNGGTNAPANPATYTTETPTINLADPTRAGYDFWFWFPLSSIPQGSIGDRYVWAIWKAPTNYSITYNLNGGTNSPANPSMYNVESSTINLAAPTRTGYTFAGWSPTDNIPAGSTGDKEFTASWTPITYSISYDLAGGVNDAGNPASYTIETPTFSLADPTREFYTFAGWTPSDTTVEQGSTGDLSFTASWTPITYNITYNLAGGVNDAANPATYTVETATFTLANPTRLGYTFNGWDPTDTTIELGSHGDLTFTAAWTPIVYPITYVMNGGANAAANPATYTIETPTITLAAPTQAGYAFLGWTPAAVIPTGTTGALTFAANWSAPLVYPITYVLGGGTNAAGNPGTYTVESPAITLGDATRAGYDFLGWTPTDNIPAGSIGARTFTATWSDVHVHTVTYFVNGGTEAGLDGATPYRVYTDVAFGSVVPVPANPSQDQYTFDGWTTAIPVNMPDADVVIYGSMTQMPALQEIIANERTPLAGPTWSLLNLILTAFTVVSIGTILSIFQKKRENKGTKKNTAFSLSTLLPAAGVVVAFIMTQVLAGTMVFTDRWSYLFAGITLVQAVVVTLALTGKAKKV